MKNFSLCELKFFFDTSDDVKMNVFSAWRSIIFFFRNNMCKKCQPANLVGNMSEFSQTLRIWTVGHIQKRKISPIF